MALSFVACLQSELRFNVIIGWVLLAAAVISHAALFSRLKCFRAVSLCLLVAVTYVGGLYVWQVDRRTGQHLSRDHDMVIRRRFISVTFASVFSLFILTLNKYITGDYALGVWETMGFRLPGIAVASVLPLILTMILFAGPLLLQVMDGVLQLYLDPRFWLSSCRNYIWIRNHVMAPITEEFTFRCFMIPLLVPCFGLKWSIIVSPMFFGIAHFHHMMELLRQGYRWQQAVINCLFQFLYTTVFGIYSAFLFARTGHFVASCLVHSFCNHMGVPNWNAFLLYKQPMRTFLTLAHIAGVVGWYYLLFPMTNPELYKNTIWMHYW